MKTSTPTIPSPCHTDSSPAEQQWQQAFEVWQTSSNWRQQWDALKKLVRLDLQHFPGRFLPVADGLLSGKLPHNICWLKTVAQYGTTGRLTTEQADSLWLSWERSCQRLLLRKWPDDNQLSWHIRALSGLDQRWFPGRLRPFLFQILEQSHTTPPLQIYDWRVFRAIQSYMRHDTDEPAVWHQWHEQWQKLLHHVPQNTRPAFFALESLLQLDEFHLPGIAHSHLCHWLHTFSHITEPPTNLYIAMRRYTLKIAREGHDELAQAWMACFSRSPQHHTIAFQTLTRLRSRLRPETWAAVCSVLKPSSPLSALSSASPAPSPAASSDERPARGLHLSSPSFSR